MSEVAELERETRECLDAVRSGLLPRERAAFFELLTRWLAREALWREYDVAMRGIPDDWPSAVRRLRAALGIESSQEKP